MAHRLESVYNLSQAARGNEEKEIQFSSNEHTHIHREKWRENATELFEATLYLYIEWLNLAAHTLHAFWIFYMANKQCVTHMAHLVHIRFDVKFCVYLCALCIRISDILKKYKNFSTKLKVVIINLYHYNCTRMHTTARPHAHKKAKMKADQMNKHTPHRQRDSAQFVHRIAL